MNKIFVVSTFALVLLGTHLAKAQSSTLRILNVFYDSDGQLAINAIDTKNQAAFLRTSEVVAYGDSLTEKFASCQRNCTSKIHWVTPWSFLLEINGIFVGQIEVGNSKLVAAKSFSVSQDENGKMSSVYLNVDRLLESKQFTAFSSLKPISCNALFN